jgi:hypothetical protein
MTEEVSFSRFPHIEQFRTIVKRVRDTNRFDGFDGEGNPIFNDVRLMPVLKFKGRPKLHGTNAAVGIMNDGTQWTQSRVNIITPLEDNAGFSSFVYMNKELFAEIANKIEYDKTRYKAVVIYGEWCGGKIQKSVALNQLEKMFVAFKIKLVSNDGENNVYLHDSYLIDVVGIHEKEKVFNITIFDDWEVIIDFTYLELSSNILGDITAAVEVECPVGRYFFEKLNNCKVWLNEQGKLCSDKQLPPPIEENCLAVLKKLPVDDCITLSI